MASAGRRRILTGYAIPIGLALLLVAIRTFRTDGARVGGALVVVGLLVAAPLATVLFVTGTLAAARARREPDAPRRLGHTLLVGAGTLGAFLGVVCCGVVAFHVLTD